MTKKEMKRFNRMKKEITMDSLISDWVAEGGSVKVHPINGDPFGDGIPRMITVWSKGE